MIILPRQARDEHRVNSKKESRFVQPMWESTWRWMLNDRSVPTALLADGDTAAAADVEPLLLQELAAAGAGATAEGLQVAYQLANQIQSARTRLFCAIYI
jgi:hypothetical protein